MKSRGQRVADTALCGFVLIAAFLYRFNALGGMFGGFSNDDFGYLARARQMQAGDVPFRDFNDPGWFLTDGLSALAQAAGGYNLRSQAILTATMLAVAALITFVLARRAAGSSVAALAATALHVALEPRHYNYPKLVLYALGVWLSWQYVERPSRPKAALLGALVGVGFLFRHDHLIYLGALALATMLVAHRHAILESLRAAVWAGAAAALFIVPFLGFLAANGGVGEYFRAALVYVQRDAARTTFSFPVFTWDRTMPLATTSAPLVDGVAAVNVRWAVGGDAERRQLEMTYGLEEGTTADGTTWAYRLRDTSRTNVERLVRDPRVVDTHGIDRSRFEITPPEPAGLRTQFDGVGNATATLYYLFLALPWLALALLLRLRTVAPETRVMTSIPHWLPFLAVAVMLTAGFLSRGSTNIRIPDVGVTSGVMLAWLMAVTFGRDAVQLARRPAVRTGLRLVTAVLLLATVFSINGLAHPLQTLRDGGFTSGPGAVAERTADVWEALGAVPSDFADDSEQPELLQLAAYVHRCTAPGDRLFVLGHYPELYYFADRPFAGGHAWLLPEYYSDTVDETRIVDRLRSASVPVVVTEDRATYENDYRPVFEILDGYLRDHYVDAGEVTLDGPVVRVLVTRDAVGTRDARTGLPCFGPGTGARR